MLGYLWWGALGIIGTMIMGSFFITGGAKSLSLYQNREVLQKRFVELIRGKQSKVEQLKKKYGWTAAPLSTGWSMVKDAANSISQG